MATRSERRIETVRRIALALPGVEKGTSYGTIAFRVGKKLLARLREDGESLAIRIEFGEREILMELEPATFYITEHYRHYPMVLVHLDRVPRNELARLFEQAWRKAAPKKLLKGRLGPGGSG
jgi:hypothetical protein